MSPSRRDQSSPTEPPTRGADDDPARTLHARVADLFRANIDSGAWPAHYKLRAEPDLAVEVAVSRGTLRRALRTLIDEGRLSRVHGRGTFVNATEPEAAIAQEMLSLSEALARQGLTIDIDVLEARTSSPPEHIRALLRIAASSETFRLTRRYLLHDQPIAHLVNHVRLDICPDIHQVDFAHKSLFGVLEGEYGLSIASGRRTFAAQGAGAGAARSLELAPGSPTLYLEQVTYLDDGTPIEYSDVWIRGDRLKLSALVSRASAT